MWWQVEVSWVAATTEDVDGVAARILGRLDHYHAGAVAHPDDLGHWATIVSLDGPKIGPVASLASVVVRTAAQAAGLDGVEIVRMVVERQDTPPRIAVE